MWALALLALVGFACCGGTTISLTKCNLDLLPSLSFVAARLSVVIAAWRPFGLSAAVPPAAGSVRCGASARLASSR
jgi:hypothetical protein